MRQDPLTTADSCAEHRDGTGRARRVSDRKGVLLLMALLMAIWCTAIGVGQWQVWGQPDRDAVVTAAVPLLGSMTCGRSCRCPATSYTLVDVAPGGTAAHVDACAGRMHLEQTVRVRHRRDDPTRVQMNVIPGWQVVPYGPLIGVGTIATLAGMGALLERLEPVKERLAARALQRGLERARQRGSARVRA